MCGISGIVSADPAREIPGDVAERMRDALLHRGPDGAGLHLAPGVAFGHRRLSIVDIETGQQPMYSADQRYVVVYNGEIFNHPTLREELERSGVVYRTRSDTETLLHLFERHGADCVSKFRGMFAFAVWDTRTRELFLARDRFGVKPLYYVLTPDGSLHFASEIKALLAGGGVPVVLNAQVLPDLLANHAPSGEDTLFRSVKRLPPGHTLIWKAGQISIQQYWDLPRPSDVSGVAGRAASDTELVKEYRRRLTEAVRIRLMSDVPVGVFLSGGIDSAAITAIMSRLVAEPVQTFSVAFAEREANELEYARLVAARYNTRHHEVILSPGEFFRALPQLVWHEDEPLAHPSSVALHFVARLAATKVKVVLTGEGSDELLAGYNRYRVTKYNLKFAKLWAEIVPRNLRDFAKTAAQSLPTSMRLRRKILHTFIAKGAHLDDLYFDNFAVFTQAEQSQLLSERMRSEIVDAYPYRAQHRAMRRMQGQPLVAQLLYVDSKTYLHELLMKQDQMSMAASVESRVPFLDHPLAEWLTGLPERFKLRGTTTKWLLREAMRDSLPREILERPKMGFPVPIGEWFRGEWRCVVDEFVLADRAASRGLFDARFVSNLVAEHLEGADHSFKLWALVNFEIWSRIFLDGDSPVEVSHAIQSKH